MTNNYWTFTNYQSGECTLDMVNTPKFDPDQVEPEQAMPTVQLLDRVSRRRLVQELQDKLLQLFHNDPEGFLKSGGSSLNKFLDVAIKLEEQPEQRQRRPWVEMTTAELTETVLASLFARNCPHCGKSLTGDES